MKVAIHHVALDVDDLDAALRFYVDGMGFTELRRPDFGFPRRVARHRVAPGPPRRGRRGRCRPNGGAHFALHVEDRDAAVDELRAKGIKVDPVPEVPGAGRQAFLTDPAGNLIELNQPTGPVP